MVYKISKILAALVIFNVIFTSMAFPTHGEDLEAAASDHEHHGRVQIKVYRGPSEHSGHDYFAPWGYWVKQPADH
ncbi:unnamed protein product [Phyllotreta striolata]|uniref:Uncharacterized protein n=1 Tax=Phyllotreta striolata TaxID=444603 RepID=A0A9P0GQZ4_PHYSR|nr:unnamed protein product [Phyllotreta striolata]